MIMSGRNGLIAIVLAVACMAGLAGCPRGAEFSQANYQTVFTGQQQHEVQSKLGRPQTETPEYWQYISLDP